MQKPLSRVAGQIKKGALTRRAAREGKTPKEYCKTKRSGVAAKECSLAHTFNKYRSGKKRSAGRRSSR